MNVIFVEPSFPMNQREFVRGLHEAGAQVFGIGERPAAYLDEQMRHWLSDYVQISSVVDERALRDAVRRLQKQVWVDRLEATVEAHIFPAAKVREASGIPGTSVRTAWLCRDKPSMKQALRDAGIPTAQSTSAESLRECYEFAERAGFPLVVKPRSAAGASGTYKVGNRGELDRAVGASGIANGASVALEEFIEGHEGFLDTLSIGGNVVHEFITHYYPNVLEAMRNRWISPQMIATNRVDAPGYDEVKLMARKVIQVLGIGSSATHMEWFFGPKGLKFSEIGCRPPGVCQWDVYNAGNDMDLYREWGMAIVHGRPSQQPSRRYAAGMIALRPDRDGRIAGYEGVDRIMQHYGNCVVAAHFPAAGTPTQPIEAGYMANAWMRVRHPDYEQLRQIMNTSGETIRVRAR